MMYGVDGWGWAVMTLMPLLWISVLAVSVWAAVRLAQPPGERHRPGDHGGSPTETPREILDRRFAAGELDVEAYDQARERLAG